MSENGVDLWCWFLGCLSWAFSFDCWVHVVSVNVDSAGGPWLITDMRRGETIFDIDPQLQVNCSSISVPVHLLVA